MVSQIISNWDFQSDEEFQMLHLQLYIVVDSGDTRRFKLYKCKVYVQIPGGYIRNDKNKKQVFL